MEESNEARSTHGDQRQSQIDKSRSELEKRYAANTTSPLNKRKDSAQSTFQAQGMRSSGDLGNHS